MNMLVSYLYDDLELFDILHIVNLCGVKRPDLKYNQFKSHITHYSFKKNQFGGYIVKHFVNTDTLKKMIHSKNKVQAIKLANVIGIDIKNYYITK